MKIILNRALSMVTTGLWDAVLTIFILTLLSSVQTVAISTDSFIRLSKYLYIHPSICSSIHSFICISSVNVLDNVSFFRSDIYFYQMHLSRIFKTSK